MVESITVRVKVANCPALSPLLRSQLGYGRIRNEDIPFTGANSRCDTCVLAVLDGHTEGQFYLGEIYAGLKLPWADFLPPKKLRTRTQNQLSRRMQRALLNRRNTVLSPNQATRCPIGALF